MYTKKQQAASLVNSRRENQKNNKQKQIKLTDTRKVLKQIQLLVLYLMLWLHLK